jgi:hypothetical protein
VEKQRREELTLPDVGKRTEQTTPEMGAARTRPWGRDVGLGEDTNELDLLQRRLKSCSRAEVLSASDLGKRPVGQWASAGARDFSRSTFIPSSSPAHPNRVPACPIGSSAARASISHAAFPRAAFPARRLVASSLSGRGAGLPRASAFA